MANQRDINRWKKGKDHWNKWAQGRLKAKEKLETEGKWEVDQEGNGLNAETKRWIDSASVDFSQHSFAKEAGFAEIIFPYFALFTSTKFGKGADFREAIFYGEAGLRGVIFFGTAWFRGTTFFKDAWFQEGSFTKDSWFDNVTFSGNVNFRNVRFLKEAYFTKAIFSRDAMFNDANFRDEAFFGDTTFTGKARFDGTTFSDLAWFNRSTFSKFAGFGQCIFDGNTIFDNAKFFGDTSFRSAESGPPFSLAETKFSVVPNFIHMDFKKPLRLDGIEIQQLNQFLRLGNKEHAARYRALKKIAIESHDHDREQNFFAGEIRERRGNDDPFGSPRYILSIIYELFSDFGRSILRPLAWLFGTWLVMAAAYGTAVPAASRQGCGWNTTWLTPEHYLSLLHTLPFVGLVRSGRRELALKCLYGSETGFGAGTDVLFIAHNTFAAVLIFLFFLAVRNHFKIK